ncbi:MAG TPA: AmmeMemoRadiSam system protein B [Holophagaceae bacterium]|nr:AmmeMemoRadiSam system protein B [Holophagaceae bacterium]
MGKAQRYPLAHHPTGLIVPHHLLVSQTMADAFATVRGVGYRRVVLLCPDHFHMGRSPITVVDADFDTPFGVVRSDRALVRALAAVPGATASDALYREHGFGALMPFLRHELPEACVCVVAIKANATRPLLDGLFDTLSRTVDRDTLILESTDFSHYLPEAEAEQRDAESRAVLLSEDPARALTLHQPDHLDSAGALYLHGRLQKEVFQSRPHILTHLNSQRFADHPVARTTSYFVVAYTPDGPDATAIPQGDGSFLFGGDVMLGRGVEAEIRRTGPTHPFQDLTPLIRSASGMLVNLEGPLSSPLRPAAPLRFHFDPTIATALAGSGITHAGLANNHGLDQGPAGLDATRGHLQSAGITPLGHPGWQASPEVTSVTLGKARLQLVAFNATEPYFPLSDRLAFLRTLKAQDPAALLVVSIHWGQEYLTQPKPVQQRLGRAFVDAGADLVVGHHPHVIQGLERYRGRLIAYSIGNLIFDQWSDPRTADGLILRLRPELGVLELVPLDTHARPPHVAGGAGRARVLEYLRSISSPVLHREIMQGSMPLRAD